MRALRVAGDRDEGAARHLGRAVQHRAAAVREARTTAKQRIAESPTTLAVLRALSFAMKVDLLLFGGVTSGPFFALLVKDGR